jgi:hypothetical protein
MKSDRLCNVNWLWMRVISADWLWNYMYFHICTIGNFFGTCNHFVQQLLLVCRTMVIFLMPWWQKMLRGGILLRAICCSWMARWNLTILTQSYHGMTLFCILDIILWGACDWWSIIGSKDLHFPLCPQTQSQAIWWLKLQFIGWGQWR